MKKLLILLILMSISLFAVDSDKSDSLNTKNIGETITPLVNEDKKEEKKEKKEGQEEKKEKKVKAEKEDKVNYSFFKKEDTKIGPVIEKDSKINEPIKKEKVELRDIEPENANNSFYVSPKRKKKIPLSQKLSWLGTEGLRKSGFMTFGGMHQHLYSYTDRRYSGDDQGDYVKSQAVLLGFEYWQTDLSNVVPSFKDIKFGTTFAFYNRGEFEDRKLDKVTYKDYLDHDTTIEEEHVFDKDKNNQNTRFGRSWVNMGFFAGVDKKWMGFDLGLTFSVSLFNEKVREYKDGSKKDGRGYVFEDKTIYPNVHFRLGREDSAHFVFNVAREDYDPIYGVINMYVYLPLTQYFHIAVGGYVYQTDAIFIQPTFKFGDFKASLKLGTIISYQDYILEKVGISDTLFSSLAITYEW